MTSADQQPLSGSEVPPRRKGCTGFSWCKAFLVIYSILFLLIGAALLVVGVFVTSYKQDYQSINDLVTSPALLAVVAGAVMVIFAFFGLIGSCRESIVALRIFLGAIIIVFIVQIIVGILAFVYREQTGREAEQQLEFALGEYHKNQDVQHAVDYIQEKFTCCGLKSPADWNRNENYTCKADSPNACALPDSCCKNIRQGCGTGARKDRNTQELNRHGMNTGGCFDRFRVYVEHHLDQVGATVLGLAIPQILGIFLVYIFIQKVEDRRYLFKYRKRIYED